MIPMTPVERAEHAGRMYSRLLLILNSAVAVLVCIVLALIVTQQQRINVLAQRAASLSASNHELTLENAQALDAVQALQKARAAADASNNAAAQARLQQALATVRTDLAVEQAAVESDLRALYAALRSGQAPTFSPAPAPAPAPAIAKPHERHHR